jgi:predicted secreted protein
MALINGTTFNLFYNGNAVGHSNSSTFSINIDLPDATTKSSAGFQEVIAGVRSGTISVSGLVDPSDVFGFNELAEMILLQSEVGWVFEQSAFEGLQLTGNGYVKSVEQTGDLENPVAYDIEIQLSGIFAITNEQEGRVWNTADVIWNNANFNWELA